ncbi:MAG: DEAD/DEAH box helicase, partial [Desulfobulbaceae bacterium]
EFDVPPVPGRSRFHDFDIDLRVMRGIYEQKFQYCTPIQTEALPKALSGMDLIGRAQTGTGKTAVFLISLLCRILAEPLPPIPGQPRALIIVPTRELAIQIAKEGRKLGAFTPVSIFSVYGGQGYQKQAEVIGTKPVEIVVATPGRLLDFMRRDLLTLQRCRWLVIDEADRMLDMGFIPDVRKIIDRLPEKKERQTMLFSATISDDVRRLSGQWSVNPILVESGEERIDVAHIDQYVYLATGSEKFTILYNLITQRKAERILVFVNTKSEASSLAKRLNTYGCNCNLLTGDVSQHKRLARLEAFRSGKNSILVATDVAGRGIHVSGINYVVNYTLPFEPEDYVHRIGRTGRAGEQGVAISFACETGAFYLPAIEEYLNRQIPCVPPDDQLLIPLPAPPKAAPTGKRPQRRRRNNKSRNRRPRARSEADHHA